MGKRGKKYRDHAQKIDNKNKCTFEEAVQLAVDSAYANFDEGLDLAVRLGGKSSVKIDLTIRARQ